MSQYGIYQTDNRPAFIVSGNDLYLMWKDSSEESFYLAKSTDYGLTWNTKSRINGAIRPTSGPAIAIASNGIKVLAYRGIDMTGILWYSTSTDFVTWTNGAKIRSDKPLESPRSTDVPALAANGNIMHLLWKSDKDKSIWYSSLDTSVTPYQWDVKAQLRADMTTESGPALVIAPDGSQHLVYRGTDNALKYSYKTNSTVDWSSPTGILGASTSEKPTLAYDDIGRLHLVFKGISDNSVYHAVGTYNGTSYTFANLKQINTAIQTPISVALTFVSGKYHLAYRGTDLANPLLYATSLNGEDWQSLPRVGYDSSDRPALACSLSSYLLMWRGAGSDTSIYRSVSYDLDNTGSWKTAVQINPQINANSGPSLAISNTGLHFLVFQGLNNEVLYSTSIDGQSWSDPPPSPSLGVTDGRPTVAISGDTVFIAWKNGSDNAIYLTKSDDAGTNWDIAASIGQYTLSGPSLVYNGDGRIHIAFRGTDNYVYYTKKENGAQNWDTVKLNGTTTTNDSPVLLNNNGNLLIYFKGTDDLIYYSVSNDQFKDWTLPVQLNQALKTNFIPAVLVRDRSAQMVIRGLGSDNGLYHTSGLLDIYWRAPIKVRTATSSNSPTVSSYEGEVYVVFKGSSTNLMYYSKSITTGNTWEVVTELSEALGTISTPALLDWESGKWAGGNLRWNLVFRTAENTLMYSYHQNDYFDHATISNATSNDGPTCVYFQEKMFVLFRGVTTSNIYSITRTWGDTKETDLWGAIKQLPTTITSLNRPAAVVSGSFLNLFFKGTDADSSIWYARSNDGTTWPYVHRLQGITDFSPGAALYRGRLYVVWKLTNSNTVRVSNSDESGYNWSDRIDIPGAASLLSVSVAAINGRLHLVFLGTDNAINYCMGQDVFTWKTVTPVGEYADSLTVRLEEKAPQSNEGRVTVPIKICFNQEIHKLPRTPSTYESLRKTIISMFADRLPESWISSYIDSQGDNIMLSDENDLAALIEESEKASNAVKIHIFSTNSQTQTQNDDYQIIDTDVQEQIKGETSKPTKNQVKKTSESRLERVLSAKKIVKKLSKSDLTEDKREQLENEFNRLRVDLTQEEIVLAEKYRVKCAEKRAEKEAQRKSELKALLISLLDEQAQANIAKNYSHQVVSKEEPSIESKEALIQVPKMKKKYPAQVHQKAEMMKNIFTGSSTEELLEFVSTSPDAPLEQLVRSYVSH